MKYTINIEKEVDLDEIKQGFFQNSELRNTLIRVLGPYETSLVDYFVSDGISSLEANVPAEIPDDSADNTAEDDCPC